MSDQVKRKAQSSASVQSDDRRTQTTTVFRKKLRFAPQDNNITRESSSKNDISGKRLNTNLEQLKLEETLETSAAMKPDKGKGKAVVALRGPEPVEKSSQAESFYQQDWTDNPAGNNDEAGPSQQQAFLESDHSDLGYEESVEDSDFAEGAENDEEEEDNEDEDEDDEIEEEGEDREHVCGEQCRKERIQQMKHVHSDECTRLDIFDTSPVCICIEDPRLRSKRILSGELNVAHEDFDRELKRVLGHMYPIMQIFERAVFDGSPSQAAQAAQYGSYPIYRAAIRKDAAGITQMIRSDWTSSMSEASWSLYNVLKAAPTKYKQLDNWPVLPRELEPFKEGICSACGKPRGSKRDLRCGQEIVHCVYPGEEHRNWSRR